MNNDPDPERPISVVTTCKARDLPVFEISARKIPENLPCRAIYVVAPDADCRRIERRIGGRAHLIPESGFIPGITIDRLRRFTGPGLPAQAGWYFQQFLKLQFAFVDVNDDYYLIWDADTIPLRPMRFFDAKGRMLLTRAEEYHEPYFRTYRRILGSDANREYSFISQHMVVQKSIAREMLGVIESRIEGDENWAMKIMRSLEGDGNQLFSEYETYGHYVKNHYFERLSIVDRQWRREWGSDGSRCVPSEKELIELSKTFDYAAFERVSSGWRLHARKLLSKWRTLVPRR